MQRLNVVVDDDADANAFCLQQCKKMQMLQNVSSKQQ
jgi:hypothetical protein